MFEMPGLLEETLEYMDLLKDDKNAMLNIIQGSLWKEKIARYQGKIVLPLTLFSDDYENDNPLDGHKGLSKSTCMYLTVNCLPPSCFR